MRKPSIPAPFAILLALALPFAPVARAADEAAIIEAPPAKSVKEEPGAIDRGYEPAEPGPSAWFPAVQESLAELPPFLRDTELELQVRSYYFRQRRNDGADSEAWALGGALRYQSGWLADHVQIGATLFTSQKLYGPSDRDGTLLLGPGQDGYTVAGEAFLRLRLGENELTGYRHRLELPYLNGNDSRMTPNTFEGVSAIGRNRVFGYTLGHLFGIKLRNDNEFVSFSEAAGVPGASSNGLSFAGVVVRPFESLSIGAVNQYVKDTLNTAYVEADWADEVAPGWELRLASQLTHQRSVGDDRLTGESFETWVWGAKAAGSWEDALVSVAVSVTRDERRVVNPFGSYPGYLAMMQRNFNDANEKAWGLGASTYFGFVGVPQLSFAARYTEGYDRKSASGQSLGDRRELNTTVDYRFQLGLLRGLWLRARFAWGEVDGARRDSLEGRVVLRYDFPVLTPSS